MRIIVTGAGGFLGRAVVSRLAAGALGEAPTLRLNDLRSAPGGECVVGSYADPEVRRELLAGGVDVLFHLASLPGGAAETRFDEGREANLLGSLALIDDAAKAGDTPVVVYSSSIAVLGMVGRDRIDADTALRPSGSYGAHKAMVETYIADLTRRGAVDGRSVRPAGIVARPIDSYSGFATAWMSELFSGLAAGRHVECPLAADRHIWLQSLGVVADNILHAARMPAEGLRPDRAWTLPATVARLDLLTEAVLERTGRRGGVSFGPGGVDQPALDAGDALAIGFRSDGGVPELVDRVLAQLRDGMAGA